MCICVICIYSGSFMEKGAIYIHISFIVVIILFYSTYFSLSRFPVVWKG